MGKFIWVEDFCGRFANDSYLSDISDKRLHGSITLNFSNGVVTNYDLKIHQVYLYTTPNLNISVERLEQVVR